MFIFIKKPIVMFNESAISKLSVRAFLKQCFLSHDKIITIRGCCQEVYMRYAQHNM